MDTIAEKLNLAYNSKNDIKAALAEKGLTVSDVFSTYADQVRSIGVTATDDGAGNVTIKMVGAAATYNNGNVTVE